VKVGISPNPLKIIPCNTHKSYGTVLRSVSRFSLEAEPRSGESGVGATHRWRTWIFRISVVHNVRVKIRRAYSPDPV
jgi:hypothetical protein